jgi:hypothetical protein
LNYTLTGLCGTLVGHLIVETCLALSLEAETSFFQFVYFASCYLSTLRTRQEKNQTDNFAKPKKTGLLKMTQEINVIK